MTAPVPQLVVTRTDRRVNLRRVLGETVLDSFWCDYREWSRFMAEVKTGPPLRPAGDRRRQS